MKKLLIVLLLALAGAAVAEDELTEVIHIEDLETTVHTADGYVGGVALKLGGAWQPMQTWSEGYIKTMFAPNGMVFNTRDLHLVEHQEGWSAFNADLLVPITTYLTLSAGATWTHTERITQERISRVSSVYMANPASPNNFEQSGGGTWSSTSDTYVCRASATIYFKPFFRKGR